MRHSADTITYLDMCKTTLVFDAGSTKTEVGVISRYTDSDAFTVCTKLLPGINPLVASDKYILDALYELDCSSKNVERVFFYGAGCASEKICSHISDIILQVWCKADVEVASDMLGAARGLLHNDPGVVCILGTGSNSALYNGSELTDNIPPLGYILGDEGSGTALGKRLIADVLKRIAPEEIRDSFFKKTGLTKDIVIEKVYRGETPNKFLGSVVPFIKENIENPYVREMAENVIGAFFDRNLMQYENVRKLPVNFVGSIASHFSEIVMAAAFARGISVGKIHAKPMEGLIEYHLKDLTE